ncbi:MAG: preprotein translocase subunit SecE [Aquihabitans sp.]
MREVNAELRKVAWPTRRETINLSIVVLIFLIVMAALIALFDYGSSKAVLWIIQ